MWRSTDSKIGKGGADSGDRKKKSKDAIDWGEEQQPRFTDKGPDQTSIKFPCPHLLMPGKESSTYM